jgi:hypothetical protein
MMPLCKNLFQLLIVSEKTLYAKKECFFRLYCEEVFTTEDQRGEAATKIEPDIITTKVAKSTKLEIEM